MYALRFQLSEFLGHYANTWNTDETVNFTMGILISDSKNLFDRLSQTMLTLKGAEKRSDLESLCLKESTMFNKMYDQSILSGKRRKSLGLGSLDSQSHVEEVSKEDL